VTGKIRRGDNIGGGGIKGGQGGFMLTVGKSTESMTAAHVFVWGNVESWDKRNTEGCTSRREVESDTSFSLLFGREEVRIGGSQCRRKGKVGPKLSGDKKGEALGGKKFQSSGTGEKLKTDYVRGGEQLTEQKKKRRSEKMEMGGVSPCLAFWEEKNRGG